MKLAAGKFVFLTILLGGFAVVSQGQSMGSPLTYEVKFEKGVFVKKDSVQPTHPCPPDGPTECGNGNYTNLTLKATRGDRVRITLSSETGGAVFTILGPDRGPLKNGSTVTSWSGTFSLAANFPITVYTNKSFTHFTFKIVKLN